MLILFESAAGYALFKVLDEKRIQQTEDLWRDFQTPEAASKIVSLKAFEQFENNTEALKAAVGIAESKLTKDLKKLLKKQVQDETLGVLDPKLGNLIKEKLGIQCVFSAQLQELARGLRAQAGSLISSLTGVDQQPLALGLSHSLSRYKLKFSPDKVDVMIIQAIGLLDDLDKELNTYAMRVREWYGWHFPEMSKIVADNVQYSKSILHMGMRTNAIAKDFSGILEEEVEQHLKDGSQVSMGTEISKEDLKNIQDLAQQVVQLQEYRAELFDYLKNRMQAIAPNLTTIVGELVGARLIAHAGSLMNLAKAPGSTVQILGAEKALFRALKTKKDTPKYGLIYHCSLVGQTGSKFKGKVSRMLASKCALSIRVDALGDTDAPTIGIEGRNAVERRIEQLEGRVIAKEGAKAKGLEQPKKYDKLNQQQGIQQVPKSYKIDDDIVLDSPQQEGVVKKRKKSIIKEAVEADSNGKEKTVIVEQVEIINDKQKKKKRKTLDPQAENDQQVIQEVKDQIVANDGVEQPIGKKKKKSIKKQE